MYTIAIDGPSAAGKSSTATMLSKKLDILHLNTGALYRAIAYHMVANNIDYRDQKMVEDNLENVVVDIVFSDGSQQTILNGVDVSDKLHSTIISDGSSVVSSYVKVRDKMLNIQRDIAKTNSVIMEGRDIGTKVLPDANFKFFLVASAEKRAERRYQDLIKRGEKIEYSQVLNDIIERDWRDEHRENSPLIQADDAILVNSDNLNLEEVVDLLYKYVVEGVK